MVTGALGELKKYLPSGMPDAEAKARLKVTLMPGRDDGRDCLTVEGAKDIAKWLKGQGIKVLGFWSFERDKACKAPLYECSGIANMPKDNFGYYKALKAGFEG